MNQCIEQWVLRHPMVVRIVSVRQNEDGEYIVTVVLKAEERTRRLRIEVIEGRPFVVGYFR